MLVFVKRHALPCVYSVEQSDDGGRLDGTLGRFMAKLLSLLLVTQRHSQSSYVLQARTCRRNEYMASQKTAQEAATGF